MSMTPCRCAWQSGFKGTSTLQAAIPEVTGRNFRTVAGPMQLDLTVDHLAIDHPSFSIDPFRRRPMCVPRAGHRCRDESAQPLSTIRLPAGSHASHGAPLNAQRGNALGAYGDSPSRMTA
jgi:hypothetical protein